MTYDCINGWEDIIGNLLDHGELTRGEVDGGETDAVSGKVLRILNRQRHALRAMAANLETGAVVGGTRGNYEQQAECALAHLRSALQSATDAKALRTVARIKLAISSAKGACRAARYRDLREAGQ